MSLDNKEKIREFIKESSSPLIIIPKNTDGDMVSSALALFWALKKAGKNPRIVCLNKIPHKFSFLTGYDLIEQETVIKYNSGTDLIFTIGELNSESLRKIYSDLPVINVDYHNSADHISISEIIARTIEESSFLEIDNETANLLLVGIIEKTDNLKTVDADSEVACLAKYLFSLGARRNEVVKYLSIKEKFSKLKQTLIAILFIITAGIFLFQFTIFLPQFTKDSYNSAQNIKLKIADSLEMSEVLKDDNDDSKKIESEEFVEVFVENNNIENKTATVATTITKNLATGITENKELPQKLEIPKLGIKTIIQHVGLDANQKMKVPSNNSDVAWFNLGPKPGEIGSAVIVGHLDTKSSQPAVFWGLHSLRAGDDIFVIDGNNNKKHFQVVSSEKYGTETAPMEKIFGANDGIYLNLITCGGVWDKAKNNYSERVVIFTKSVL